MNELTEVSEGVYTYKGCNVTIEPDDYPDSPREWDEFTTMSCFHRRYTLGDEQISGPYEINELYNRIIKDCIYLPLYLYDHSGITMNTEGFADPWDSGIVGFIWVDKDDVRKEYECQRISKRIEGLVIDRMRSEVASYDQFISGDVWYYSIEFPDDTEDSCSGMYGFEYTQTHVVESIDCYVDNFIAA